MVQILPAPRDQKGDDISEIIQLFGKGLQQGISSRLKAFNDRKAALGKVRSSVKGLMGYFDKGTFDPETAMGFEKRARELIEQGLVSSPDDAVNLAYAEHQKKIQDQAAQPKSKAQGPLESLKSGAAAMGTLPASLASLPFELLSGLGKLGRAGVGKLAGVSPEEMQARESKLSSDIAAGEKATGVPSPLGGTSLSQAYRDVTGGRSVAKTPTQRILQQAALGPIGLVGGAAEEAARGLGVPEEYLPLANITGLVTGGKLASGLTNKLLEVANRLSSFKSASKHAAAAGVAPEAIVEEAASKLQGRGVDLTKVAEGDAKAVNELHKEIKKTAETFKEAERFGEVEAVKRRAEVAKKLPESPLAEYYKPTGREPTTAEGIAAKELRLAPLKERVKILEQETKGAYRGILEAESLLKQQAGKLSQEQMARLEANRDLARLNHQKMLSELRNTEFEIKHGKPPITTEELTKQIEKQHAELREGIKNPTADKIKKVSKQLEKDKEAIETAKKLVARGELPGPEVFDEFIKIHQEYNKAYDTLLGEMGDFIKSGQNIASMKAEVENARKVRDLVKQMKAAGEARVIKQIDKRKALRHLEKPSGAFYKNMLKDLKNDVDAFRKEFFRWQKVAGPGEAKAAKLGAEKISKEIPQTAKMAAKNPTAENISKLAEESGVKKETLGEYLKKMRNGAQEAKKSIDAGTATEKTLNNLGKDILSSYTKLKPAPKAIVSGITLGTVQALADEYFGYRPTVTEAGLGSAILTGKQGVKFAAGTGAVSSIVFKMLRSAFESSEAKKLHQLRNTPEFTNRMKELKEKYGSAKVSRIRKKATEAKS